MKYTLEDLYSQKEIILIKHYGLEIVALGDGVFAPQIYRLMIEKAFIRKEDNAYSESVRNCAIAINECKIYRRTPEWEALILVDA